jgi:hypothetical protein
MAEAALAEHSVILALWIPVAVFTHVFAALWLLRAFQLMQPAAWAKVKYIIRLKPRPEPNSATSVVSASHLLEIQEGQLAAQHAEVGSSCSSSLNDWGATGSSTSSSSNINSQYPAVTYPSSSSSTAGSDVGSLDGDAHAVAVLPAGDLHANSEITTAANKAGTLAGKQRQFHHPYSCHHPQQQQQPAIRLTWRSIGCVYKTAAGAKPVLHDVWGEAAAGEMQVRLSFIPRTTPA